MLVLLKMNRTFMDTMRQNSTALEALCSKYGLNHLMKKIPSMPFGHRHLLVDVQPEVAPVVID